MHSLSKRERQVVNLAQRGAQLLLSFRHLLPLVGLYAAAQEPQPRADSSHGIDAIYRIAGQPTGSYHETAVRQAETTVTTISSDLIFNRMGNKLEMKSTSQYSEVDDGRLKAVASDTSSSEQMTHIAVVAGDGSLQISTTTGGKTYERNVLFTGTLVGAGQARKLLVLHVHKPGDTFPTRHSRLNWVWWRRSRPHS